YDSKGELVWEMLLDVYGEVKECHGDRTLVPFRYQGQYEDGETGLYYNRFRYYSPDMGMYISSDPIGLAGNNPTLYGYVQDVNIWLDPWGLKCLKNKKTFFNGKSRRDAFRQAKRDAGIPMSQHPQKVYYDDLLDGDGNKIIDRQGYPVQSRNYEYVVSRKNSSGDSITETITIQEHSYGHTKATTGHGREPHFNVRDKNLKTGSVEGTHGHYNFP
ncbi:RHS repeat-associated core domain-containing protein, partial [Bacteroides fragilis]